MALKVPKGAGPNLFKEGYSFSQGIEDAVIRNIHACTELTNTLRTSFGPNGRNKIIINHIDKTFLTSDAATIVKELEVVHPAAKVLVQASEAVEAQVGDRTNLVLVLAGQLLAKAENLITNGLHPSEIIQGYELARDKLREILPTLSNKSLEFPLTQEALAMPIKTVLASKQYGHQDLLSRLVSEACLSIMPTANDVASFNVDSIRTVKIVGGSLEQSTVVRGMVLPKQPEGVRKKAEKCKVAVFTGSIDISQTETKGTVLLKSAEELMGFSKGEETQMEKILKEFVEAGVQVVIAGSTIGELAQHYLDRYNILTVKVISKFDLRRLCRVLGASPLSRLGVPTPEEMGYIDTVETIEIGGQRVTVFRQDPSPQPGTDAHLSKTSTIVLRGSTINQLEDMERSIDDAVNSVKSLIKDPRLIPGAGATEVELAQRLADWGDKTPGLTQHAIKRYAEALEVVPRTLAENAGLDATQVLAKLYSAHQKDNNLLAGVDIENDDSESPELGVIDVSKENIWDSLAGTDWAVWYATEAAVTVLRVDSVIMSKASGIAPKQNPNWDED